MEKELAQYRKTLHIKNLLLSAGILAMLILLILGSRMSPIGGDRAWTGAWSGFISGCSCSLAAVMAVVLVRNVLALRDEEKLRRQYIKYRDERTLEIFHRAGHSSYWFEAMGLLVATVVAGYFSPAVSLTCLGCTLYVCLVRLALKIYYTQVL